MAVVGETPNVAARLQELAEPGTVLVGREHASAGRRPVRVRRARSTHDQGHRRSDRRLPGARSERARSRFEATAIRGLTPLVGRDEELNLLLSRWAHAKEGEGQVVLLTGEPGIGKSRIIQAFRELVRADGVDGAALFLLAVLRAQRPAPDPRSARARRAAEEERSARGQAGQAGGAAQLRAPAQVARAAALLAPLLSIPTGERYPAARPHARTQEDPGARGPARAAGRAGGAAGPDHPRGCALDRSHLRRAVPSDHRSHPAHAGPGADRLSARLHARPGPDFPTSRRCRSGT